jgi:hypothetical protein
VNVCIVVDALTVTVAFPLAPDVIVPPVCQSAFCAEVTISGSGGFVAVDVEVEVVVWVLVVVIVLTPPSAPVVTVVPVTTVVPV